jgi:dihydrofolate reductase
VTVSAIAAVGKNGVIGREGKLPWVLPRDLRRFRAVTWGKPIIMGRKTHEALGRALPGRTNIILTRQTDYQAKDCLVAHTSEEALRLAELEGAEEAVVIGGSEVFAVFLPKCETIYLTTVEGDFEGDTFFPMKLLDPHHWEIVREEFWSADARNPFPARHQVLMRRDSIKNAR